METPEKFKDREQSSGFLKIAYAAQEAKEKLFSKQGIKRTVLGSTAGLALMGAACGVNPNLKHPDSMATPMAKREVSPNLDSHTDRFRFYKKEYINPQLDPNFWNGFFRVADFGKDTDINRHFDINSSQNTGGGAYTEYTLMWPQESTVKLYRFQDAPAVAIGVLTDASGAIKGIDLTVNINKDKKIVSRPNSDSPKYFTQEEMKELYDDVFINQTGAKDRGEWILIQDKNNPGLLSLGREYEVKVISESGLLMRNMRIHEYIFNTGQFTKEITFLEK